MEVYLLKSAACLAILLLFYKLFLENTSFHNVKRIFLLGSLITSLTIPLITFTTYVEVLRAVPVASQTSTAMQTVGAVDETIAINYWPYVVWTIYGLGVLFFMIRFGKNLWIIFNKVHTNRSVKRRSLLHVLLRLPTAPHSFFKYVFFNRYNYETNQIPEEVILHEEAHAKQYHSWDILLIEVIRIVFWFNPLFYFYKKSIQLNHEFLADRAVLQKGADQFNYQNILLDFSSTSSVPQLAHSFNYSSIKKRFTVMKKQTSKKTIWLLGFLLIPVLAMMLYGFSEKKTALKEIKSNQVAQNSNTLRATEAQLRDYNSLAKKYNAVPISERKIGWQDLTKLEEIYRQMSNTQRENALPFPECLPKNQRSWEKVNRKNVSVQVQISTITINAKTVSLENFANEIDEVTKNWTTTDFKTANAGVFVASTPISYLKKVASEFEKTRYYKITGKNIIPTSPPSAPPAPPVPPQAPNSNGTSNKQQLPPPPPPPSGALGDVLKKYKNSVILYVNNEDIYLNGKKTPLSAFTKRLDKHVKGWTKEDFERYGLSVQTENLSEAFRNKINEEYRKSILAKRSSRKNPYIIGAKGQVPPPPPPPPGPGEPLDHVVAMAKRNATFYFEKDKISSDRAIELIKENPELYIQTQLQDPNPPKVYISEQPIIIKSKKMGVNSGGQIDSKQPIYPVPPPPSSSMAKTDPAGYLKELAKRGATFYLGPHAIPLDQALELLEKNDSLTIDASQYPKITFGGC